MTMGAAALSVYQEYLYILCEFVEYGFETIGSKQRRLSNKMYKYSRFYLNAAVPWTDMGGRL